MTTKIGKLGFGLRSYGALLGMLATFGAAAEVSVTELERTCTTALDNTYVGVEAAACDWYLDPCTVCGVSPPPVTWCVPPTVTPARRARRVLSALLETEGGSELGTPERVRRALTNAYPCSPLQPARSQR
jgi:hypothetical protein